MEEEEKLKSSNINGSDNEFEEGNDDDDASKKTLAFIQDKLVSLR